MGVTLYLSFYSKVLHPSTKSRLILLISTYLFFLFMGAYLFTIIDNRHDTSMCEEYEKFLRSFADQHQCISIDALESFMHVITDASSSGISFINSTVFAENFKFGGETLFFTFTLLSTIGYGYAAPLTFYGKLFCIFYISLGVPLSILILGVLIERLDRFLFLKRLYTKRFRHRVYHQISSVTQRKANKKIYIHALLITIHLLVCVYIIPAYIFSNYIEMNWSFLDSLYYCFISITTIGFGEFIFFTVRLSSNKYIE
jgi:hypothetical protein